MAQKLMLAVGQYVLYVLAWMDRVFTGSQSGLSQGELLQDPYKGFSIIRSRGTILRSYSNRGWMVLGFDEVQELFRDADNFGSDIRKNKFLSGVLRAAAGGKRVSFLDDPMMLNLDPPDHTRLRKLVSQGFVHKFILSLEPRIEQIVDDCLASYDPATGQFDVVTQLAKPLPAIVIAELLGLPESDLPTFQQLSEDLIGITAIGDDALVARGTEASDQLMAYFAAIIEEKRKAPGQDLIGRLIAAEEEGDRLTAEEMYSTCVLMLVAGHETTTRLIGNGMYTLLRHPEQFELLKRDPDLAANAVEEMLRFEPPVQLMPRFAKQDTMFHGKKIRKDQLIIPVIASANRDPDANDDPDVFDITRTKVNHISFGHGIHLCLGMNLARIEARVAINALLKRFPDMSLDQAEADWAGGSALVRGMNHLCVNVAQPE